MPESDHSERDGDLLGIAVDAIGDASFFRFLLAEDEGVGNLVDLSVAEAVAEFLRRGDELRADVDGFAHTNILTHRERNIRGIYIFLYTESFIGELSLYSV